MNRNYYSSSEQSIYFLLNRRQQFRIHRSKILEKWFLIWLQRNSVMNNAFIIYLQIWDISNTHLAFIYGLKDFEICTIFGFYEVPSFRYSTPTSVGDIVGILATSSWSKSSSKGTKPLGIELLLSCSTCIYVAWISWSSIWELMNSSYVCKKLFIYSSFWNTCPYLTLSGTTAGFWHLFYIFCLDIEEFWTY